MKTKVAQIIKRKPFAIKGLFLGLLSACFTILPSCNNDHKNIALSQEQCEKYYHYIKSNNVDSISALFGVALGEPAQRQLFAEIELRQEELGDLKSAKLTKTERNIKIVDGKKNDIVTITFKVEYDSSYYSREQFYFHIAEGFKGIIDSMATEGWDDRQVAAIVYSLL